MLARRVAMMALGFTLAVGTATAQDVGERLPGATRVVRPPEVPVAGLVKRDPDTVAFTVPGKTAAELLIHDFDFNGDPVTTDKVHLRQVAPGVVEITSVAWEVGYWRFEVRTRRATSGWVSGSMCWTTRIRW